MSFKFNRLVLFLFAVTVLLAACQPGQGTPQAASPSMPDATVAVLDSPLPAPTATLSALDSPLPTPTRGPSTQGRAAVRGVLFLSAPEFAAPEEDGIYLVQVDPKAGMVFPAVDPKTSLQAEVDEVTGEFFFDDVEMGLYALVSLTLQGAQLSIRKMDSGEPLTVLVGEQNLDQVIDLGRLVLP